MEWFVNAAKSSLTPRLATFRSWVNCWPCLRPHWRRAWSFNMPLSFTTLGSLASFPIYPHINYLDSPRRSPGSPGGRHERGWIKGTFSTRKPWILCQILWGNPDFPEKTLQSFQGKVMIYNNYIFCDVKKLPMQD